jgi:DNA-binding transcriptional ArsR family regulator
MDAFVLVAERNRRRILDHLRIYESDVAGLVDALSLPQPLVSKHLRVLRDAGAVTATVSGQRRLYRLTVDPLPEVLAWVAPYYQRWSSSLDRLATTLDEEENQ